MRVLFHCFLVCLVAAGCTPDPPDNPAPPHPASTRPPTPPSSPTPVTRPLDPSAYGTEDTVCDLLTAAQATTLNLPEPAEPQKITDTAMVCSRQKPGAKRWLVEYELWLDFDLLGELYRKGDQYELRDVEGQPAAVQESKTGSYCILTVRLAEQTALKVTTFGHPKNAACALVTSMAEQIVQNLAAEG